MCNWDRGGSRTLAGQKGVARAAPLAVGLAAELLLPAAHDKGYKRGAFASQSFNVQAVSASHTVVVYGYGQAMQKRTGRAPHPPQSRRWSRGSGCCSGARSRTPSSAGPAQRPPRPWAARRALRAAPAVLPNSMYMQLSCASSNLGLRDHRVTFTPRLRAVGPAPSPLSSPST